MGKLGIIAKREILYRIRKKSFIIMLIIGPLVLSALMLVPVLLSSLSNDEETVVVNDETGWFEKRFKDVEELKFLYFKGRPSELQDFINKNSGNYILTIDVTNKGVSATLMSGGKKTDLVHKIAELTIDQKATSLGQKPKVKIIYDSKLLEDQAQQGAKVFTAYTTVVLIYFFIFLYGIQVMKGVIEEKSNRIVELMISSVSPFQLMIGKILGMAVVGLIQYIIWVLVGMSVAMIGLDLLTDSTVGQIPGSVGMPEVDTTTFVRVPLVMSTFLFYFLGGYFIYASLFAAIGSASDSDTETHQFTFPVTMPLLIAFISVQYVVQYPNSDLAVWLSIIPFTSPVVMMARIPFVELDSTFIIQLVTSMGLLLAGFIFITWIAGRIYKVGILLYGSRVGYRDLIKWIFKKNS